MTSRIRRCSAHGRNAAGDWGVLGSACTATGSSTRRPVGAGRAGERELPPLRRRASWPGCSTGMTSGGVVEGLNICMRPSTHRHRSLVSESAIAPTHSLGATNSRPRQRVGKTYAVRRPYAKYATGTAPAELVSITATAHLTFEPRTSLAGRRARSTRAAALSTPSTAPTRTISLRARGDRSLHLFLPTTSTLTRLSPL